MAGTGISADLILSTLGLVLGLGLAATVVIGLVFVVLRPMAEAEFGPSRHPTQLRPRQLTLEAEERWLAAAAYRRAIAVGVALLGLVIASPWLSGPIQRYADRWRDAASDDRQWRFLVLATVLWLGFLPLSLFLSALPRRAWSQRTLRSRGWATRLGTSTSPGLPSAVAPGDLDDTAPYYVPLKRACRLSGTNSTLGADGTRANHHVSPLTTVVVPLVVGLLLAGFVEIWVALVAAAIVGLGLLVVGIDSRRRALDAPGTAVLDYLILVAASRDGRRGDARTRAEAYLVPNPATLQDHANLMAAIAGARWIDEPHWDTVPAAQTEVVIPATVDLIDRHGQTVLMHLALRLVRGSDRGWQIVRIWTEQTAANADLPTRSAMPLPVAW